MKKSISLVVAVIVVAAALVACQFTSLVPTALPLSPTQAPAAAAPVDTVAASQPVVDLVNEQDKLVLIYQQVSPSVVSIMTSTALGSGWVYDSNGYIVTNNHVVEGETRVEVDFINGEKVYGKVAGVDQYSDLAIIKIDPGAVQLHPLTLGDSSSLKVGQIVVAIGNPFGLNGTMTTGIISALGRTLLSGTSTTNGASFSSGDIIQTDAPLNPGNSGGPLLNLDGEVVGVNSAIRTDATNSTGAPVNSGIGFAISVNTVKRVVPSLISNGRYDYPYLGITSQGDLTLDMITALGLKSTTGAYVTDVAAGGPSDRAGLRAGTKPITVPGYTSINSGGDLITYLALNKSPGDTVTLTVLRGDQQLDIPVVLGARP